MNNFKWIVGIIVAAALAVIVISAIVPEKDCAGNNTWNKDKVCTTPAK